jgi:hypothetical protein
LPTSVVNTRVHSARIARSTKMNIKTNVRAGKGGASGSGKNSSGSYDAAPVYVAPVSRCAGI